MKAIIRNLEQSGDPIQTWSPKDLHEALLFLKDEWEPVHIFLEKEGIPLRLEHPVYEHVDRSLLDRVKLYADKVRKEQP